MESRKLVLMNIFAGQQWRCPGGTSSKEPVCQYRRCKRCGFDPWVRNYPWRRAWQPTQYSCLENDMDSVAWQTILHRVTPSQTQLKRLSKIATEMQKYKTDM